MSTTTLAGEATAPPAPLVPGDAEPTAVFDFASRDGTGLYGEWFAAADPRGVALVMHGYAEHCGRYRELAHVLTGAGLSTLTYDMRGHGRAEGQRGHVGDYREYLADMRAALDELDSRAGGDQPVLLVGHSNGGLIVLRALADRAHTPRRTRAAVISSPYLALKAHVPGPKKLLGQAAGRLAPTLSLPSELKIEHLTHDHGKLAARRVDTLCHEVASAGWFVSSQETQAYVRALAHRIRTPTLWLIAGADLVADPAEAVRVHHRLRAPSQLHRFPGMYHEVFNETERGRVFGLVTEFVSERFPKS